MVEHGGVCLYIKDRYSKYHVIDKLKCCEEHEILWVHLRPKRLPRGYSCLIIAIVYHAHPSFENDNNIRNHHSSSLALAESIRPDGALVVCGDFNRLILKVIKNNYHLKQIVKGPTRKNAVLDLILTKLAGHYANPEAFPSFALSDHNTVLAASMIREGRIKATRFILKRDLRTSRKAELGRYLSGIDWHTLLNGLECCENLLEVFQQVVSTALDLLMPLKRVLINTRDAPWMTKQLKSLVVKR